MRDDPGRLERAAISELSGLDAACLYLDTPTQPMNNLGVLVLDPSTAPGGFDATRLVAALRRSVRRLPLLRRRLATVPLGLEHPVWVELPDLRVEDHVQRVPAEGAVLSERALARRVGRIAAQPLDRSRPLWAVHVVEGLAGGRIGLVMVVHHALADGVAGAALMAQMLDLSPEAASAPRDATAAPAPEPGATAPAPETPSWEAPLLWAARRMARRPAATLRALGTATRAARDVARQLLDDARSGPTPALPLGAPAAPWNGPLSTRRTVAYARSPRSALEYVRRGLGGTFNDVVLAACTLSLRQYLEAQGESPDVPLLATLPVSVRSPDQAGSGGNRISAMFVRLPVHLEDPFEQLVVIQRETRQAKRLHRALGGELLCQCCEVTSPALFAAGARIYAGLGLSRYHPTLHNLVISNVPGPPQPLYAAGARVVSAHPHGPLLEGVGMNLTVMSYADSVDFGLIACPERVPDAVDIATGFSAAVGRLVKLALDQTGGRPDAFVRRA